MKITKELLYKALYLKAHSRSSNTRGKTPSETDGIDMNNINEIDLCKQTNKPWNIKVFYSGSNIAFYFEFPPKNTKEIFDILNSESSEEESPFDNLEDLKDPITNAEPKKEISTPQLTRNIEDTPPDPFADDEEIAVA